MIAGFRAAIADIRYTAQGEAKLMLTVPYGDRHEVNELMDLFGLELRVEMRKKAVNRGNRG